MVEVFVIVYTHSSVLINLTDGVINSKNGKWRDMRGSARIKDTRVQSSATKVLPCPLGAMRGVSRPGDLEYLSAPAPEP